MIDRLNFYDLYGYVLPGFVGLALFWLPFGWFGGQWPKAELTSAVAALAISYVVGLILQSVATDLIPSKQQHSGKRRHPSDFVLDAKAPGLSDTLRDQLCALLKQDFGLDVKDPLTRNDAFLVCRAALISNKAASYAEQFQGMYALTRGLWATIALSVPYYAGWALSGVQEPLLSWRWWSVVATMVASLSWLLIGQDTTTLPKTRGDWRRLLPRLVAATPLLIVGFGVRFTPSLSQALFEGQHRSALWIAVPFFVPLLAALSKQDRLGKRGTQLGLAMVDVAVMAAFGFTAASRFKFGRGEVGLTLGGALCLGLVLWPLWYSYRRFAFSFAVTTYRDYVVLRKLPSKKGSESSDSH